MSVGGPRLPKQQPSASGGWLGPRGEGRSPWPRRATGAPDLETRLRGEESAPGRPQRTYLPMRQPRAFGKYLLLERISVGGMAEVFRAKSFGVEGFEKIVAVKRILPPMGADEDFIRMFIDEAKIAGQLSHANIGQIFELGTHEGCHYIAMEFIWGVDLLALQNRYRARGEHMPVEMAVTILMQVCEAPPLRASDKKASSVSRWPSFTATVRRKTSSSPTRGR